jgi:O-antigen/teichoic acid export membrane protein
MEQAIFRHLIDVRKDKESQKKYISNAIATVGAQSLIFSAIYILVNFLIDSPYKHFLAANVVVMAISNLLLQICRGLGDNLKYSIASVVSGITTILLNVLFIAGWHWGAYGMLTASLIGNVASILFVFFAKKIYRYFSPKYLSRATVKELWKYSIPLIPNQLSWWIINASDRTVIYVALGEAFNGIYSAANKFSSIITTVFNIFNLTWAESAALHIRDGDADEFFTKITANTVKLFSSLCLGVIACMPFVFPILIRGEKFADAYYQIPILLLSTIFSIFVSLMGSIYVALKKSKEIAKTSTYAAIINLAVNIALVRFIGLYAASISTLVAFLAMSIYRYVDVQKYVKIKLNKGMILGMALFASVVCASYYLNILWLNVITLAFAVIVAIVLNFGFLSSIYDIAIKKMFSHLRSKNDK